jgi:uncharacterized protein (DUF1697 family)
VPTFIALLRGVNVGGRNRVPMDALRALAEGAGLGDVRTYIQSGNLLFSSGGTAAAAEARLEAAIARRLGLEIPVVVRAATRWAALSRGNPLPQAAAEAPGYLHLALSKAPPAKAAVEALRERATAGELIEPAGRDGLWIHFTHGAGRSKLTPVLLDRLVGSPVTARNWRTVVALGELAGTG